MADGVRLTELRQTGTDSNDGEPWVELNTVEIDPTFPIEERMTRYLKQIKNPYRFLCGGTPVRIRFTHTGKTLDEAVKSHFLGLKSL